MALKLLIFASSARLALSRKKSSSLGMRMDPAVPAVSLANVARQLQPAMRYLTNFSFKPASGVTMDTEGSRNVVVDGGERCLSCARPPRLGH